jgi:4-oxalocrotonate tautomerase
MPYVNIKVTREGVTRKQKKQIIHGVTALLSEVLGKDPATTFVVLEQVDLEDWGIGGLPVDEYRANLARKASEEVPGGGSPKADPEQ